MTMPVVAKKPGIVEKPPELGGVKIYEEKKHLRRDNARFNERLRELKDTIEDSGFSGVRMRKLMKAVVSDNPDLIESGVSAEVSDPELKEYALMCITSPGTVIERQDKMLEHISGGEGRERRTGRYGTSRAQLNKGINEWFSEFGADLEVKDYALSREDLGVYANAAARHLALKPELDRPVFFQGRIRDLQRELTVLGGDASHGNQANRLIKAVVHNDSSFVTDEAKIQTEGAHISSETLTEYLEMCAIDPRVVVETQDKMLGHISRETSRYGDEARWKGRRAQHRIARGQSNQLVNRLFSEPFGDSDINLEVTDYELSSELLREHSQEKTGEDAKVKSRFDEKIDELGNKIKDIDPKERDVGVRAFKLIKAVVSDNTDFVMGDEEVVCSIPELRKYARMCLTSPEEVVKTENRMLGHISRERGNHGGRWHWEGRRAKYRIAGNNALKLVNEMFGTNLEIDETALSTDTLKMRYEEILGKKVA